MPHSDPKTLVSTAWLAQHLKDPDLRIFDASWYLPEMGRDAVAEYDAGHIPGARYFDIDDIADQRSNLPHMVPPVEKFISRVRALGVGDGHQIVVYDGMGLLSAARVWWMFRLMGKTDIAVLDGGMPKWQAEGHPTEDMPPMIRDRHITVQRQAHMVKDVTQVAAASKLGDYEIVDVRSSERFKGQAPEPREGLRSGHIPGSKNLYYGDLLNGDSTLKSNDTLKSLIDAAGIDLKKPIISTCGSGVTAAILDLALERIGHKRHAVYDGSWSEWGQYKDLHVETGG